MERWGTERWNRGRRERDRGAKGQRHRGSVIAQEVVTEGRRQWAGGRRKTGGGGIDFSAVRVMGANPAGEGENFPSPCHILLVMDSRAKKDRRSFLRAAAGRSVERCLRMFRLVAKNSQTGIDYTDCHDKGMIIVCQENKYKKSAILCCQPCKYLIS